MRVKVKRAFICVILFSLLLGICAVLSGCFSSGSGGGLGGGKKPNERTENDINLSFDAEEREFSFDAVDGATRYSLYIQAKNSDFEAIVGSRGYNEGEVPSRISFYSGSDLKEDEEQWVGGAYLLLTAYGDSYQDKDIIRRYRLPWDFLAVEQDSVVFENEKLTWGKVESASSYLVRLNGNPYYTAETEFDVSDYGQSGLDFTVSVTPIRSEQGGWMSVPTDEFRAARVLEPRYLSYNAGEINWSHSEIPSVKYYTQNDLEYVLTYRDGEEVQEIVQSSTRYAYKPKTGSFSFSVKARLKADADTGYVCMDSKAVEYTPTYYGTVENFTYDDTTKTFSWDLNAPGFTLYVDGEEFDSFEENSFTAGRFYKLQGVKELRFVPHVDYGYCTDFITQVRFAQELQVELSQTSANGVCAKASGFQGAASCLIEPSEAFEGAEASVCKVQNDEAVFTGTIGDGITEARGWIDFTPIFDDGIPTVTRYTSKSVYHHAETPIESVSYYSYVPYVEFEANHTLEVELNGEITQVFTGRSGINGMFKVPVSEFGDKNTENTVTLRVRTLEDHSYGLHMPSEWYEVEIRRLAAPQNLRVENGVARWEYEGAWELDGYDFDLQGEHSKTNTEEKEIVLEDGGMYHLQVKALADVSACSNRVWYIDSVISDHYTVIKLMAPSVSHTEYGIEWEESGDTDCYEVVIKAADGVSYQKTLEIEDNSLLCTEYLKAYHTLELWIKEKGNGTNFFDGETTHLTITRNPGFTYSMYNTMDSVGELSRISWEYFDDTVTYDYYVKDPLGEVIEEKTGVKEGQTSLFYAPEEVGASVLGINVPATVLKDDGDKVFLLKTGEDEYDYWEQEIWKMYAVATVNERGALVVESFPKITSEYVDVEVMMGKTGRVLSSNTGVWVFEGASLSPTEGNVVLKIDIEIGRTDSAKLLLFYNPDKEATYDCTVKKADAPALSASDYTPGEKYYDPPDQLDASKTVLPTVYWLASPALMPGCTYTYNHYDIEGALLESVTSAESGCRFTGDVYDDYTVRLNANVFVETDGALLYYLSSDESEMFTLDVWTDLHTDVFTCTNGVLSLKVYYVKGDVVQLFIGDNQPVDAPLISKDGNYATYSYDTGLSVGEKVVVMLWRVGDTEKKPDGLPSYKCYITVTMA